MVKNTLMEFSIKLKQAQNLCISAIDLDKFKFSKFKYCANNRQILDEYRANIGLV